LLQLKLVLDLEEKLKQVRAVASAVLEDMKVAKLMQMTQLLLVVVR
jgi:hypothetical protein